MKEHPDYKYRPRRKHRLVPSTKPLLRPAPTSTTLSGASIQPTVGNTPVVFQDAMEPSYTSLFCPPPTLLETAHWIRHFSVPPPAWELTSAEFR